MFKKNGYQKINQLISEPLALFLGDYAKIRERDRSSNQKGYVDGDAQAPGAYSCYGDLAMDHLMIYLRDKVCEITGIEVVPSYTFFRNYIKGNDLKKHKDRPSCEISLTMNLSQTHPWAIHMENSEEIFLNPGDAVIYRGYDLEHWREEFDGESHVQVFAHYVDKNGPYVEHYMDKRGDYYRLARNYGLI